MATLEIDPDFNIHTSYHNDFFLLRTRVLVNGENTEVRSVKEGKYEGPVLNFCHSGSTDSTTLSMISKTVSPTLVQYGVYHVDTFYYEQSPLFHVVFTSESCLKSFILAIGEVKSALEPQLQSLLSHNLKTELAQQPTVEVQPDLFLVSPNRQETKGAEVLLVTAENCSTFAIRWKDSKLFDFGLLYQEDAKSPKVTSQPVNQNEILPGKNVTFSVEATGTKPLSYQWQWKPFGKVDEKDEWQNLSAEDSTFQVEKIQASNAGYYRCVVSNSAGSEASHYATLTVVPEVCDLANELQKVIDWIYFGLNLGLKMEELETIEVNYPTLQRRHIEMFKEWQKKVTPTWSAVVQALMDTGMRRPAFELAQKHGVPPPKLPDDGALRLKLRNISQQEKVTGSKLRDEFQKRGEALEQNCRKGADAEKCLKQLQESKSAANEKFNLVMSRIEELHKKVQKIVQEKKVLEIELQSKQTECQLLSEIKARDSALEEKISKKRKKIEKLKKKLQAKESDLHSSLENAKKWQEELSQAQVELKEKHEEVKELREEKEKLACSFNIEQEQVSKLVQLTVTLTSEKTEMEQQLRSIKEESERRLQLVESCNLNISCLSEEVKQKETTVAQLKRELQSYEQVYDTPEQLLELLKLEPQVAELQHKLQETENQKQLLELEREAAFEEVEAMQNFVTLLHNQFDEPPKITSHPKSVKETTPGKPVTFTVQATGTKPLTYQWQWKPAKEDGSKEDWNDEDGSEEWQPCRTEWSDNGTLTIPSVQKFNAGSYRCVIRNYVSTIISKPAQLSVVCSSPAITSEEQARRLRMTQAGDQEEVAVSGKSHRRKRKKKIKKISSRYSTTFSSLLNDMTQDHSDPDTPTLPFLNLEDYNKVLEEHSTVLADQDTCTQAEESTVLADQDTCTQAEESTVLADQDTCTQAEESTVLADQDTCTQAEESTVLADHDACTQAEESTVLADQDACTQAEESTVLADQDTCTQAEESTVLADHDACTQAEESTVLADQDTCTQAEESTVLADQDTCTQAEESTVLADQDTCTQAEDSTVLADQDTCTQAEESTVLADHDACTQAEESTVLADQDTCTQAEDSTVLADQDTCTQAEESTVLADQDACTQAEESTVLADQDTCTQAEDSTVLADHDTCTQAEESTVLADQDACTQAEESTVLADQDTCTQAEDSTVLADHDTCTQAEESTVLADQDTCTQAEDSTVLADHDTCTQVEDSTVLADQDACTQAEDSTVLADQDACTQAISEHTTSEEVVTEIQELTHRGQKERSAKGTSATYDESVQATNQEGSFIMVDGEVDSVQFVTEKMRGLAEGEGGQLSMMMFEDSSLLESAVDTVSREPSPKHSTDSINQGDPFFSFSHSSEYCTSLGHSLPAESKRRAMSPTPEQDGMVGEGGAELSDSSHDSDTESRHSVVVSDYYKLCGTLAQSSNQTKLQQQKQTMKGRLAAFPHRRDSTSSVESLEDVSQEETIAGADIWVPIPHPSRTHLRSVCLSEELLWVVDIRGMVFCTTTESKGRDWEMIPRSMEQITSSSSGKVVWGLHHQNAYVRLGIGMNPAGSTWRNMTKGTTIAHKIKHIAADENGVWAIKMDGQVLFRKGVTEGNPEGRVWQEVGYPAGFTHVACCNETIWAITSSGKVFIRYGITPTSPSGKKWIEVKAPKLMMVALTSNGVVWGVDQESQMGFRCGITRKRPQGKGPWWEVSISALTHPSSPYNSLWQVMSTELGGRQLFASLPPSVSSLVTSHPVHHKLVAISASAKIGVVLLEAGSKLHACWRSVTGYHYTSACRDDVFQLTTWTKLVVGSTALWLVRDDGELYCLTHEDKLIRIEYSGDISLMAASPSVLWAVFNDIVWSRQGMMPEVPEGISWDYIELSTLLQERKLRHIACGNRSAWAIDSTGVPHFRFGVHAREPGTGMSPAWVPVNDNPDPLLRITVSPDDWLVWACGENYNVYVRIAVTQGFPVGTAWELVQSERAKELCASSGKVYALTPSGELLCRFGITESNLQGNYWRRMPGKYAHITTSPSGDLWTLDEKGQVWKQEWKAIAILQDPGASRSELEMSMVVDHSWEVV